MKKLKQRYRCMEDRKYGNGETTGCPTKTHAQHRWHDRQTGFTLVELVIVIAIVIILSVISVPIYRGYIDKAKWSEAYALFGTILSAQKTYYSEYGNFLNGSDSNGLTCYEIIFGIDARGNKYFTRFAVGTGHPNKEKYYFDAQLSKPEEFKKNNDYSLVLHYNITKGAKIVDWPINDDSTWYK